MMNLTSTAATVPSQNHVSCYHSNFVATLEKAKWRKSYSFASVLYFKIAIVSIVEKSMEKESPPAVGIWISGAVSGLILGVNYNPFQTVHGVFH